MMESSTEYPKDSPLRKAWEAYQQTEDYQNTKHWALCIAPMYQAGTHPQQANYQSENIMPHEQRDRHVTGSLWAAFMAGYESAMAIQDGPTHA